MEPNSGVPGAVFNLGSGPVPITVSFASRTLNMLILFEEELDVVAALGNSFQFTLLGIFVGGLVSSAVVLGTVPLTDRQHMAFVAVLLVSIGLSLVSGCYAIRDYHRSARKLIEMKGRKKEVLITETK